MFNKDAEKPASKYTEPPKTLPKLPKLPSVFDSYEISTKHTTEALVVTTLGGIAQIDQHKLVKLGWIKLNDACFAKYHSLDK